MKKLLFVIILVLAGALAFEMQKNGNLPKLDLSAINLSSVNFDSVKKTVLDFGTSLSQRIQDFLKPSKPAQTAAVPAATPELPPVPEATPATAPTEPATAEATPAAPTETPAASTETASSTTPAAGAPAEVDLTGLERRYWPLQVKLTKEKEFFVVFEGQESGTAMVPAGVMLKLIEVRGKQLVVQLTAASGTQLVPAGDTDIQERVREIKTFGVEGSSASASSTPWVPKLKDRTQSSAVSKKK